MKKLTLAASVLSVALGASLVWAADEPSTQPAPAANTGGGTNAPAITPDANPTAASPAAAMPSAQMAPQNWTSLKGTVQSVDPASKTVQLKDDTGSVIQVAVDRQVSIKKDGKHVQLSQVQTGDMIILAKRMTSSQEAPKTN